VNPIAFKLSSVGNHELFNNGSRQVAQMLTAVSRMQEQHTAGAIDDTIPPGALNGPEHELADASNRLVQSHVEVKMKRRDARCAPVATVASPRRRPMPDSCSSEEHRHANQ